MTPNSSPIQFVGQQSNLSEVSSTSPACVIDFFEARRRLLAESERIAERIAEPAIYPGRSGNLADAFEEGFYWLIWVAMLASLALGIFDL
jgi:hypothetical protein